MAALYIVLPLALVIVGVAVGVFVWAARDGQFDDLETPAYRVLFDDVAPGQRVERVRSERPGEGAEQNDTRPQRAAGEHESN
ncbi:MAG: cbb3-type cytochrome oxidase assembly protein CcoS [Myxococcales bacterium]|nr:cbb3-type cytochrome oxidase assembly protein CcoS [Myxococcales bacterium]